MEYLPTGAFAIFVALCAVVFWDFHRLCDRVEKLEREVANLRGEDDQTR